MSLDRFERMAFSKVSNNWNFQFEKLNGIEHSDGECFRSSEDAGSS